MNPYFTLLTLLIGGRALFFVSGTIRRCNPLSLPLPKKLATRVTLVSVNGLLAWYFD